MHTFYSERLAEGLLELNPEESSHCARVLRLRAGDPVRLVDGRGLVGQGVLRQVMGRSVEVIVESVLHVERTPCEAMWIAFAPPKNTDRTEWLVEKLVEVGVGRITPFVAAYSERKTLRVDRLERVALSALKQCMGAYLPVIDPLLSWESLLAQVRLYRGMRFIAHLSLQGETPLLQQVCGDSACCVMVGPEGGFTDLEVGAVLESGGKMVSLGERRLRVETAALAACLLVGANCRLISQSE